MFLEFSEQAGEWGGRKQDQKGSRGLDYTKSDNDHGGGALSRRGV